MSSVERLRDSESERKELTKARNTAYRYLTYRSRSRREVEDKLREKQFSERVVDAVIGDLEGFGYINDREFARQWAGSRIRLRGFGRRRIERELRDKGVSRDIIHQAVAAVFDDSLELDIACEQAEKKLKALTRFEPEVRRRRLAAFLERKGFSSDIILTILQTVL